MTKSTTWNPRRNARQQFIAKFKDQIQGVMSGLDRVLFRGSLRRLTHSLGMKWYLSENHILCKKYEDHVKDISQKVKQAALEPFQRQKLLVKHVYGATTKNKSRGPSLPKQASPKGMCAPSAPWRWLPPSGITRRTW